MKPGFRIECYYEGRKATIYTVLFEGEEMTELDYFLSDEENRASVDFLPLIERLKNIIADKYGAREEFFRQESRADNSVMALSADDGPLRLYCCRWGNSLVIAGCGGVKATRTYQEDPDLSTFVKDMEYVHASLYERIKAREIQISNNGTYLHGNLEFKSQSEDENIT